MKLYPRFPANVYSQSGEDGVLATIFNRLGITRGFCVEFGAWDGLHLSNTANLLRNYEWSGLLIEGNPLKHEELCLNYQEFKRVQTVCALVGFEGVNKLSSILGQMRVPSDFDLLSIDIDGCDYHVWENFLGAASTAAQPKVVVIEFNPTIPPEIDFVQPRDMSVFQGSSLRALDRLAQEHDYELTHVTPNNAIFVRGDLALQLDIPDTSIEALWTDRPLTTQLFVLYDGTIKLAGNRRMPWHDAEIDEERLQVLPKALRKFPGAL